MKCANVLETIGGHKLWSIYVVLVVLFCCSAVLLYCCPDPLLSGAMRWLLRLPPVFWWPPSAGCVCDSDFGMLDFNAYNDFQCRLNDQIMGHSSFCSRDLCSGVCLRVRFWSNPIGLIPSMTLNDDALGNLSKCVCQLSSLLI